VPFLVNKKNMRCPIIGTNAMQELIAGERSTEAKSKKLTQLGLQVSEVVAFSAQLDHLTDDEPLSTVRVANGRQQLLPANSCTMINCEITPVKKERETPVLFQPRADWPLENPNIILHETITTLQKGNNRRIQIKVSNKLNKAICVERIQLLGALEELESVTPMYVVYHSWTEEDIEAATASPGDEPVAHVLVLNSSIQNDEIPVEDRAKQKISDATPASH